MISFLKLNEINQEYSNQFIQVFAQFLVTGKYILGEHVKRFEAAFATFCNSKECIGVDNGSNALFLSLKVLNLNPKDEVIVAGNSYLATVLAVINNGLVPIFIEPNIHTFNINTLEIESHLTSKTKAILITHMYGSCCDMDAINHIAKQHNLYVIDDCSHAHGATYKGIPVGALCDLSAFSFYPTKNLGAIGDAGAITTNNVEWAGKLSQLRNYGFSEKDVVSIPGFNSRLDEIQAAFLSVKLKSLLEQNQIRKSIANRYLKEIDNPKIALPPNDSESAWHLFVIRTPERKRLISFLNDAKIESAIHYPIPVYHQKGLEVWKKYQLPITEQLHKEVLSIPLNPNLKINEVDYIINTLNSYK